MTHVWWFSGLPIKCLPIVALIVVSEVDPGHFRLSTVSNNVNNQKFNSLYRHFQATVTAIPAIIKSTEKLTCYHISRSSSETNTIDSKLYAALSHSAGSEMVRLFVLHWYHLLLIRYSSFLSAHRMGLSLGYLLDFMMKARSQWRKYSDQFRVYSLWRFHSNKRKPT